MSSAVHPPTLLTHLPLRHLFDKTMANLPSGQISASDLRSQLGISGSVDIGDYRVRAAGSNKCTGAISMNDVRGGPYGNFMFKTGNVYGVDFTAGEVYSNPLIYVTYPSNATFGGEKKQTHIWFFTYGSLPCSVITPGNSANFFSTLQKHPAPKTILSS